MLRMTWTLWVIAMAAALVGGIFGYFVTEALAATKQKLPRDEIYYEINNDKGDHGNFIETYHVPNGRGGKVYCVVYSDQIGDGGGAGISCDWGGRG